MLCEQELSPGKYERTNVIYSGANARCSINAVAEDGSNWEQQLQTGDTAEIVGLLKDGGVVGEVHRTSTDAGELVIWQKGDQSQKLPWLLPPFHGSIESSSLDFSRYASIATTNPHSCNALTRILGTCDQSAGDYYWFIFDRSSRSPIVARPFPKEGRAAISPDGLHYASFEAGELRVYSLSNRR